MRLSEACLGKNDQFLHRKWAKEHQVFFKIKKRRYPHKPPCELVPFLLTPTCIAQNTLFPQLFGAFHMLVSTRACLGKTIMMFLAQYGWLQKGVFSP